MTATRIPAVVARAESESGRRKYVIALSRYKLKLSSSSGDLLGKLTVLLASQEIPSLLCALKILTVFRRAGHRSVP
jgi:hypothetical protein